MNEKQLQLIEDLVEIQESLDRHTRRLRTLLEKTRELTEEQSLTEDIVPCAMYNLKRGCPLGPKTCPPLEPCLLQRQKRKVILEEEKKVDIEDWRGL